MNYVHTTYATQLDSCVASASVVCRPIGLSHPNLAAMCILASPSIVLVLHCSCPAFSYPHFPALHIYLVIFGHAYSSPANYTACSATYASRLQRRRACLPHSRKLRNELPLVFRCSPGVSSIMARSTKPNAIALIHSIMCLFKKN